MKKYQLKFKECMQDLKVVKETETKLPKGIVKHS